MSAPRSAASATSSSTNSGSKSSSNSATLKPTAKLSTIDSNRAQTLPRPSTHKQSSPSPAPAPAAAAADIQTASLASFYGNLAIDTNGNGDEDGDGSKEDRASRVVSDSDSESEYEQRKVNKMTAAQAAQAALQQQEEEEEENEEEVYLSPEQSPSTPSVPSGPSVHASSSSAASSSGTGTGTGVGASRASIASPVASSTTPSTTSVPPSRGVPSNLTPQQAALHQIMSRFHIWHSDLTKSKTRHLIKEGLLSRQATFKHVTRHCMLFNDIFVVSEEISKGAGEGKLEMKQILPLNVINIEKGKKSKDFQLLSPERNFIFTCTNEEECKAWMKTINDAINQHKVTVGIPTPNAEGVAVDQYAHVTIFEGVKMKDDELLLHLLSERGDDPNMKDKQGDTALIKAVKTGYQSGVALLLSHQADVEIRDADGNHVMHIAAQYDEYGIMMMLISKHSPVDVLDARGHTPFWVAACGPYKALKHTTPDEEEDDDTAEHDTKHHESRLDDASDEFQYDGANTPSYRRKIKALQDILKILIERGADIEQKDSTGRTIVSHLCVIHHYHSLIPLLEAHALLTTIDDMGYTPLHLSVAYENEDNYSLVIETCKTLLIYGASPNARDHQMNCPLHLTKNPSVAASLIVYGARIDLKNFNNVRAAGFFEQLADKGIKEPLQQLKEAVKGFEERPDIVNVTVTKQDTDQWLNDESSDCCFLCASNFTVTRRRHHCRSCGLLCCGDCSSKKFKVVRESQLQRCCDPCYNKLSHLAMKEAKARRKRELERKKMEAEMDAEKERLKKQFDTNHQSFLERQKEEEKKIHDKLMKLEDPEAQEKRRTDRSERQQSRLFPSQKQSQSDLQSTTDTLKQNRQLLEERGDKLNEMENKSQRMAEDAGNFASLAKQLKEKQKSSWF